MNREENTSNKCDANSLVEPKEEILDYPEVALNSDIEFIMTVTKEELSDSSMHSDTADSGQQIVNMVMPIKTETVLSKEMAELQKVLESSNTKCEHVDTVAELSGGENTQETQTSVLNMLPAVPSTSTFVPKASTCKLQHGRAFQPVVVQEQELDVSCLCGRRGCRGFHSERAEPRAADKPIICNVGELPTEQPVEAPIHPKRRRICQPSTECGGDSAQSAAPESLRPPNPRRILRDEDFAHALFYGSEPESGESDDEECVPSYITRAAWSVLDTPMEENNEPVFEESVIEELVMEEPITKEPVNEESVPEEPVTEESLADDIPPASATDQPSTLVNFSWRPFPKPVPSGSRQETFLHSNAGPAAPCVDPYDIFTTIWDRQIMEYIASETNRYAQQVRTQLWLNNTLHLSNPITRWQETTVHELYVYFGLVLAMGVVVKSRIEDYWSADADVFYTPGFSAHMSCNRFLLLSRILHFANNDDMRALQLGTSEAKLFKIQPILSHLSVKFETMYTPGQNIALDESLLMWKVRSNIGQLIPNKDAKVGIKSHEICESRTGYLWRFEVRSQKASSSAEQSEDPTLATVLRLMQGLEHKGYTLWMDDYYNSPCLARRLKSLGLDCAGTLRTNRKFVPRALHNLTKDTMKTGQISGLTAGDVDVLVYRDCNRVAMISTYHGNTTSRCTGATKPNVILDYNIMMGGVDKKDQMLAQYPIERKQTKVWYKKLFRRLLNVSVLNSYIIYRESSLSHSHLSHRGFRTALIKLILSKHHAPPFNLDPPTVIQPQEHRVEQYPFIVGARLHQRQRRQCVICRKRSTMFCVGCNKAVCIGFCFMSLHQPASVVL